MQQIQMRLYKYIIVISELAHTFKVSKNLSKIHLDSFQNVSY